MEHNNNNNKEQNNERKQCAKVENAFEYDIFLSYRYNDESDPNHPKRGVGKKLPHYLCKKFEEEGYRVWYDNGKPDLDSHVNMLKSKLCIILISDYSLAGINWDDKVDPNDIKVYDDDVDYWGKLTARDNGGKGFHKELLTAYHLLNDNKKNKDKRKPRVFFVAIDNAIRALVASDQSGENVTTNVADNGSQTKSKVNNKFSWIWGWCEYENYQGFGKLLKRVRGRDKIQFDIQPTYKYRKPFEKTKKTLLFVTCFMACLTLVLSVSLCFKSKSYFFLVGPGSVCEYLLSRGIELNRGHLFYAHRHSEEAWDNLKSAFKNNTKGKLGNFPIALSDTIMSESIAKEILGGDTNRKYRILQCLIDSIDLNVLVLQDTSKKEKPAFNPAMYKGTTEHKIDTSTLIEWYKKRKEYNLCIVGNSRKSTTWRTYSSFLTPDSCDTVDIVFSKYSTNNTYTLIKDRVDRLQTVLILDNSTIENEKNNIVKSVAPLSLSVAGQKLYLYAYTIVEIVENDTEFRFLNNQEELFENILKIRGDKKVSSVPVGNGKTMIPWIIEWDGKMGEDNSFFTKLLNLFMSI
ncbi:MAG: hypothetical protein J6X88_08855 [Bacteroidales bacterium]|nr:hypothetical protein [Bacteroidales bacterium]